MPGYSLRGGPGTDVVAGGPGMPGYSLRGGPGTDVVAGGPGMPGYSLRGGGAVPPPPAPQNLTGHRGYASPGNVNFSLTGK